VLTRMPVYTDTTQKVGDCYARLSIIVIRHMKSEVQILMPAPRYRGYNIRADFWVPRGCGFGDVEVHV